MTVTPSRELPPLTLIGNPNSAGSYAAGQDQAPAALRNAGLVTALTDAGRNVADLGDLDLHVWRPDSRHPTAQNADDVAANLAALRSRLVPPLQDGHDVLLLGGNCTGALAAVAAQRDVAGPPALLYVDRHFDANTPASTQDGALDWMGIAHALALPDTLPEITRPLAAGPLLTPGQIAFLGVDTSRATAWELEQAARLPLRYVSSQALADDLAHAVHAALTLLPPGPLVIHLDVDVLDFTDAPLAEDTAGRNSGPTLAALQAALTAAVQHPEARILSIGELNPTRSAGTPETLLRFVRLLALVMSRRG